MLMLMIMLLLLLSADKIQRKRVKWNMTVRFGTGRYLLAVRSIIILPFFRHGYLWMSIY